MLQLKITQANRQKLASESGFQTLQGAKFARRFWQKSDADEHGNGLDP